MPSLIIIAGPNGAGKSTNAKRILKGISADTDFSYDFDMVKWNFYKADSFDHEYREIMAHNRATEDFTFAAETAIKKKETFCFETNFFTPDIMYWPERFQEAGFEIVLVFVCLDTVETSILRVAKRVATGGHHVPENQIRERFKGSLENVNKHFRDFDTFYLIDGSNKNIQGLLFMENGSVVEKIEIPNYLNGLFSKIIDPLKNQV